ncbi:MAG: glycosyltransferase [Planctomycetota bacterium]|nr:MAG: glycosyltransferase [Planctomycetota bacterium]
MSTASACRPHWPVKRDLFGVEISAVTCSEACDAILASAHQGEPAIVSAFSVHALIEAATTAELAGWVNRFAMIVPDGQPVRWALNWLHDARLKSNVRGADLMWNLCQRAAAENLSIYLYGGTPSTLARLVGSLQNAFPAMRIARAESPPFRPLTADEDEALIERINASGASLMFIGLGCPKQDIFAAAHADTIRPVQICVGAAFDFHAGTKPAAPVWMQRSGLEWLYRLGQEPRRLWKRYLVTNTKFLAKLVVELTRKRVRSLPYDKQLEQRVT